jgi:hypothetical protein
MRMMDKFDDESSLLYELLRTFKTIMEITGNPQTQNEQGR